MKMNYYEFLWYLRRMLSARKYRKEHLTLEYEYQWYKYLVICEIKLFFRQFKFWKSKGDFPF